MYQPYNYSGNQVPRVSGESGARAYQLLPNSSCLLLDETAPLVWLIETDAMGYKTTVSAYKIEPYKPEPQPDLNTLLERLSRLEERLNEPNTASNGKSEKQYAKSANEKP